MRNLASILSIVVWLAAGNAQGNTPPPPPPVSPVPPFLKVTVPQGPLKLGNVWSGGAFQAEAQVNVHIVANCPYQVQASFRELKHGSVNEPVAPNHLLVAINGKQAALGQKVAVAQTREPTSVSGVNIPVQLQVGVDNLMNFRAGRYNGTLVITAMALP
jgi:hypothetical protein